MKSMQRKEQFRIEDMLMRANEHIACASNIFHSSNDSHDVRQLQRAEEAGNHMLEANRIIDAILDKARPDDGILLSPIEAHKRRPFLERTLPYASWIGGSGGWVAAAVTLFTNFGG